MATYQMSQLFSADDQGAEHSICVCVWVCMHVCVHAHVCVRFIWTGLGKLNVLECSRRFSKV